MSSNTFKATIISLFIILAAININSQDLSKIAVDFRGIPIKVVYNAFLNDWGKADFDFLGNPIIIINPTVFNNLPWQVQYFVYCHECAHHKLGHAINGHPLTNEKDADCWAMTYLTQNNYFTQSDVDVVTNSFKNNPGDWTHKPGYARIRDMLTCVDFSNSNSNTNDDNGNNTISVNFIDNLDAVLGEADNEFSSYIGQEKSAMSTYTMYKSIFSLSPLKRDNIYIYKSEEEKYCRSGFQSVMATSTNKSSIDNLFSQYYDKINNKYKKTSKMTSSVDSYQWTFGGSGGKFIKLRYVKDDDDNTYNLYLYVKSAER